MKPLLLCALFSLPLIGCDGVVGLLPEGGASATVPASETEWNAMLAAVNGVRADGRSCGGDYYPAAPPLAWNDRLGTAAMSHTQDMVDHSHFAHTGTDGSSVGDRASRYGYEWRRVGENIARYQQSVEEVVRAWTESPGHCANMMNPSFVEFGAAESNRYWTQVFGRPR